MPAFSFQTALERANEILRSQPALGRIRRPHPLGSLVVAIALPLSLLKRQNWSRHQPIGVLARLKDELYEEMCRQSGPAETPLRTRAFVRCIRFSSVEADAGADTFKMAIDVLCVKAPGKHRRLGFLVDDKPRFVDARQHWEPAPPGGGFGLLELFDGHVTGRVPCRRPACTAAAVRWYGWNSNPPGEPPRLVKAPFCAEHARELKSNTAVTPLSKIGATRAAS